MPLLTLNLSCENVKYPARKHFEKTNSMSFMDDILKLMMMKRKFESVCSTHPK